MNYDFLIMCLRHIIAVFALCGCVLAADPGAPEATYVFSPRGNAHVRATAQFADVFLKNEFSRRIKLPALPRQILLSDDARFLVILMYPRVLWQVGLIAVADGIRHEYTTMELTSNVVQKLPTAEGLKFARLSAEQPWLGAVQTMAWSGKEGEALLWSAVLNGWYSLNCRTGVIQVDGPGRAPEAIEQRAVSEAYRSLAHQFKQATFGEDRAEIQEGFRLDRQASVMLLSKRATSLPGLQALMRSACDDRISVTGKEGESRIWSTSDLRMAALADLYFPGDSSFGFFDLLGKASSSLGLVFSVERAPVPPKEWRDVTLLIRRPAPEGEGPNLRLLLSTSQAGMSDLHPSIASLIWEAQALPPGHYFCKLFLAAKDGELYASELKEVEVKAAGALARVTVPKMEKVLQESVRD